MMMEYQSYSPPPSDKDTGGAIGKNCAERNAEEIEQKEREEEYCLDDGMLV